MSNLYANQEGAFQNYQDYLDEIQYFDNLRAERDDDMAQYKYTQSQEEAEWDRQANLEYIARLEQEVLMPFRAFVDSDEIYRRWDACLQLRLNALPGIC